MGAGWMVAMRFSIRGIGLVSTAVLARLLVPADFGLVALATAVSGLVEVLGNFQFHVILIKEQDAGRDYYDTAWSLGILRGGATALFLCALALPAASFLQEPRIESIVYVLAISAFATGFRNTGIIDFQKKLDFHKDFLFNVAGKLTSFVATLVLAFTLRSYWALVLGILVGNVASVGWSYVMHPFRPRPSIARAREIFSFSKWLLFNGFLSFATQRSDTFIVGRIVGAAALGIYGVAFEIASLATTELVAPIRRALLPGYAQLAANPDKLREGFIGGFSLILLLAAPAAAGIGACAEPIVQLFLGSQWLDVIPLLRILCVFGTLQICVANTHPLYLAMGKPHLTTVVLAIWAFAGIPAMIAGTLLHGTIGTAWAATGMGALTLVVNLALGLRLARASIGSLLGAAWRPLVSSGMMAVAVFRFLGYASWSDAWWGTPLALTLAVALGILLYTGLVLVLWKASGAPAGAERHVLDALRDGVRRFARRPAKAVE